jgi:hypothetical protein
MNASPKHKAEQKYDEPLESASKSNDNLRRRIGNICPKSQRNPWQMEKEKQTGRVTSVLMTRNRKQNHLDQNRRCRRCQNCFGGRSHDA